MLDQSQNKMIDSSDATNKEIANVTIKAVSASMNEYHFPGAPDFLPINIRSTTIEEATEIWKIRRQPVKPEAKAVEPRKETKPETK
jgi:hypothetical protein